MKNVQTEEHKKVFAKMNRIMFGEKVVSNDAEMDLMQEIDDSFFNDVASIHNQDRTGLLDQYILFVLTKKDRMMSIQDRIHAAHKARMKR